MFKMIYNIARTELQMLFYSPVAWLILVVFGVQSGMLFADQLAGLVSAQEMGYDIQGSTISIFANRWGGVFTTMQNYLYFYIPLLTMSLVSKELSSGSIRLLYSSPITNTQIIVGKFFSMMIYGLIMIGILFLITLCSWAIVKDFELSMVLTGLLGLYLLICAYAAIGIFMSSLTSYQIVAAIGTFAVLMVLSMIGGWWQDYDFIRDVTYWLSMPGRSGKFIAGLICSEDVLYFVIVVCLFLALTIIRLNSVRQKIRFVITLGRNIGVIFLACFLGYLSALPQMKLYHDATSTKMNTLTPNSQEIVKKLEGGLTITTYSNLLDDDFMKAIPRYQNYDKSNFREYIRFKPEIKMEYVYYYDSVQNTRRRGFLADLPLEKRARQIAHSHKIKFSRYLSPDQIKQVIDLTPEDNRFVRQVTRESGEKMFLRQFDDMMRDPSEGEISAAFKRMVMELPTVGFLTGHGERDMNLYRDRDYACFARDKRFRYALLNQGFEVQEVNLNEDIPTLVNILVIADMAKSLTGEEMERLQRYIDRGGNLFIVGDPNSREYMNPLTQLFGVEFMEGVLVKPTENFQPDLVMSRPTAGALELSYFYETMDSWKMSAVMPGVAGLKYAEDKGFKVTPVLQTDTLGVWNELETTNFIDDTVRFNPAVGEVEQLYTTAVALVRPMGGREQKIVILGDADCISNVELFKSRKEIESGNFYIILGSFAWLSDGEAPVDVRRPKSIDNRLFLGKTGVKVTDILFKWFIPIVLLIGAIFVAIRRRGR